MWCWRYPADPRGSENELLFSSVPWPTRRIIKHYCHKTGGGCHPMAYSFMVLGPLFIWSLHSSAPLLCVFVNVTMRHDTITPLTGRYAVPPPHRISAAFYKTRSHNSLCRNSISHL